MMSYKNILVHVYENKSTNATLQAACNLALENGAHLTGIHVVPHLNNPTYFEKSIAGDLLKAQQEVADNAAAKAKAVFQKAVDAAGCLSDWHQPKGYVDQEIVRLGRYADIIVIGQSGGVNSPSARHTLENQVLLTSARPVLVVPYIGFNGHIGRRPLVAWDGSMEATRAVNDAMPLLQSANSVDVVTVVRPFDEEEIPAADMCIYLARHGVTAEAVRCPSGELSTSNILLNRASDRGIDLIVMGAYGHSRLREWVLGGATYNILQNMTVPVLMSH